MLIQIGGNLRIQMEGILSQKKQKKKHNFGFINPLMVAEKIIMVKEVKTRNLWCVPNQNGLKCKNNLERSVGGKKYASTFLHSAYLTTLRMRLAFEGQIRNKKD